MTKWKDGGLKGKRADDHSVSERVNKIYSLFVNGFSSCEILQNSALRKEFGVQDRQMLNYIAKARLLLEEEAQRTRTSEIGKSIRRYEKMYRKMNGIGDYRGCLAAQARIDDLLSLSERKKIDVTSDGKALISTDTQKNISEMSSVYISTILGDD